jgi:hypothetical protein
LPVHLHKIEVVPGFDELAVLNPHNRDAIKFGRGVGGLKAEAVPDVFAAD